MRSIHVIPIVLALALLIGGCSSQDAEDPKDALDRMSQEITGATWEDPEDPGDALNFKPNGTGLAYNAARDITAEIAWQMSVSGGRTLLQWSYPAAPAEGVREWVIEIDGDTMDVWPKAGAELTLDPNTDEPIVLMRTE